MRTVETTVADCRELLLDPLADRRGSFLKIFNASAFAAAGVAFAVKELFVSSSHDGVVRGLHFQRPPADVAKLVCCLAGAVVDAVVDLRTDSPSFGQHCVVALSAEEGNAVYVPPGCAHGFMVTRGDAIVAYAQSGEYNADLEGGILWSSAGIDWPDRGDVIVSDRDASFPTLDAFPSPFTIRGR